MGGVILLALLIVPPILAFKGVGYRGLWFCFAVAALFLSMAGCLATCGTAFSTQYTQTAEEREAMGMVGRGAAATVWYGGFAFVGTLLAGCFYRKPPESKNGHNRKLTESGDCHCCASCKQPFDCRYVYCPYCGHPRG